MAASVEANRAVSYSPRSALEKRIILCCKAESGFGNILGTKHC